MFGMWMLTLDVDVAESGLLEEATHCVLFL